MNVIDTREVKIPIEKNGEVVAFVPIGVRMLLNTGVSVFRSYKHGTYSVQYVASAKTYKNGLPVIDKSGLVEYNKPTKFGGMNRRQFAQQYSPKFVAMIEQAERELAV